ncbi:hypothetical protein [Spirosoma terrae]|uniref:Uncharacterized protein n=1 Tax=Spirosoma terrae TaxID=1968276 RepID=A0A6L9LFF7_9BACT|nr:hypothetical protein [Spirosoma terrae]NDU99234.1 hypothetical protein [Spirosoma terrae]
MEKLFDDKERTNIRYAKYQHDSYEFYDNSAIDKFIIVRERLNNWFDRYPEPGKKQLKRDFQTQFEPAFFELFIHELFFQQGFTLTTHPILPNSTKKPDFLAKKDNIEIYIEARVAFDETNEEKLLKNKQNAILDAIDLIKSKRYGISVREIRFLSRKQASLRKIREYYQNIIDHHAEFYAKNQNHDLTRDEQYIIYQDDDIRVSITLWKVNYDLDKPIISPLGGGYIGGCEEAIRDAIKAKAYKYGTLDKPFIICVNSLSVKQTYTEVVYNALFGDRRNQPFENRNNINQPFQTSSGGIFNKTSSQSYSSVSGVLITSAHTSNLHVANHWLIKHPYSQNELDFNKLALSYIHIEGDKIQEVTQNSIGEILGIK